MTEISGVVMEIVYRNDENGYTVLELSVDDALVTAVGTLPTLTPGESVRLFGAWTEHRNFGRQFKAARMESEAPKSREAMALYLSSGLIRGVGDVLASRIVETFGEETMEIIANEPERLSEVRGISKSAAAAISESFRAQTQARDTVMELQSLGLTIKQAVAAYEAYGQSAGALIAQNPYRLIDDVYGIGFERADRIGQYIGFAPDSSLRMAQGIKYVLKLALSEGHTCLPQTMLVRRAAQILSVEEDTLLAALDTLTLSRDIVRKDYGGRTAVFLLFAYLAETDTAARLFSLSRTPLRVPIAGCDIERLIADGAEEDMTLSEEQERAVSCALSSPLHVITGGPGTGKTTIIKLLTRALERSGANVALCAPTGRAAKRMEQSTGREAKTIHRLLEYGALPEDSEDFSEREPKFMRNEENPLAADAVIADEASMIDIFLMRSLLLALSPGTRLILVGDADQLPSVGPGNVLSDLIASGLCGVSRLTWFYRQQGGGGIVSAAHDVNAGKTPELKPAGELTFLRADRAEGVLSELKRLLSVDLCDRDMNEVQVLCPIKKGLLGVHNLNSELRELKNPQAADADEVEWGGAVYRAGDKVMQIKNNYGKDWVSVKNFSERGFGVFNGDMGGIASVDRSAQEVTVLFDGERQAIYAFSELEQLEHAYAVTVHKAQGSEFPVVILPLYYGASPFLTRNLLYTALTRAKERVYIVGLSSTVAHMVANDKIERRYTILRREITDLIGLFSPQ